MTAAEIVALIVALAGSVGSLILSLATMAQKARESARNNEITEAAGVITGYKEFCDDLRERIVQLVEQIRGYETQLNELREAQKRDRAAFEEERRRLLEQHERDRESWERDRADLLRRMAERERRIAELERETANLRETVNEMVAKLAEYEKREGEL